ncbi:porin family protein [Caenimonas sedimenti]|uniref:Porin family protein n=2 Tax=Caenimonas sedimenti TaxID=2596921 RepID=A0A562ZV12_9BURK|nr:porin family protein [Caenimonas sedimenti]
MTAPRSLSMLLGLFMCGAAAAQVSARDGYLGLQLKRSDFRIPCGSVAFPCDAGSTFPLYSGALLARPVGVELGALQLRDGRLNGTTVGVVGRARMAPEFGVYGRLGTTFVRAPTSVLGAGVDPGAGVSYGVGLSWDFSPSASAILGWDSYDLRFASGERDTVRSTSLGLQWRY